MDQKSRVVLVTGGLSGIGLGIVERFQHAGDRVVAVDLDTHDNWETADQKGILFVPADLSVREASRIAVDWTVQHCSGIDVLVNNAGFQHIEAIETFPEDTWDKMLHVMLTAPFLLTKYAWTHLRNSGQGRIINVASVHAQVASPFKSAYISAKHGLLGLTKTAALEGGSQGITANAICPAYVRTPLVDRQIEAQAQTRGIAPDEVIEKVMLEAAAIKRLLEPEDIAEMAFFLASKAAWGITGSAFNVDLGWTAR